MAPRAALHPINPTLTGDMQVGAKVAFHDEHDDDRISGMYGIIEAIGLDANGDLRFDLHVIDPETGESKDGEKSIYRAGMEDIQ